MVFLSFARESGAARRMASAFALAATGLALAACQSGNPLSGLGGGQPAQQEQIYVEDLRAFCPQVVLREGTASFRTYERGGDGDASRVIYQASASDVTRSCSYQGSQVTMNVALAGRIVPGQRGSAGSITLPIRIAVLRGEEVLYSQLHQYPVQVADVAGATQFVFSDSAVTFELPQDRGVRVFAGFDEGPYDTP